MIHWQSGLTNGTSIKAIWEKFPNNTVIFPWVRTLVFMFAESMIILIEVNPKKITDKLKNIARGTTDPEIESVHLSNLLNNSIS